MKRAGRTLTNSEYLAAAVDTNCACKPIPQAFFSKRSWTRG